MMKKILVITCYFDPDYVRARALRNALHRLPDAEVVIVKNSHRGLWRYPEIMWRLLRVKSREKPDAYLLTFRGQEILPFVLLLAGKKPVWFDEFVIPIAYATNEKHARSLATSVKHVLARLSVPLYARWLKACDHVLTDTTAHAALSARLYRVPPEKYVPIPVGTDEDLFKPARRRQAADPFTVFYYSTGMQPLHGIPVVLEAARMLKQHKQIHFLLAGGKLPMRALVSEEAAAGAQVVHKDWVPFETLPEVIRHAGLCLGGPFGNTPQAQHVITGKTFQFLACAAPTLVGANELTTGVFSDRVNALIVEQANARAMADAILWAYGHPKQLAAIASSGRKLYEATFSADAIARTLKPLVASL